ncbi:MAG: hypothetical protein GY757_52040 [bacterium]|nr:hypothetical protein [bacterium]
MRAIQRLFEETGGQPGLIGWFGELLTEGFDGYRPDSTAPITSRDFEHIYTASTSDLPNTNILNIISKARQQPYNQTVLELFRTDSKLDFTFDDPVTNFLYMHGVIDKESGVGDERYIRFSCPFVQKRLFNYFSRELNRNVGELYHPMTDLTPVVMGAKLDIANLVGLYRDYLENNRSWLFKDAPRRSDMKIREAVFHFNFYAYLNEFLKRFGGNVYPEFPTGNGQVDIIIRYKGECYALEVKSFSGAFQYREGLKQSARYAHKLGLPVIYLLFFIESIDDANRSQYETPYHDKSLKVQVKPIFIETGNSGERKG